MSDTAKVFIYKRSSSGRGNYLMKYLDPVTGKQVERSTGTTSKAKAQKMAGQLEEKINAGTFVPSSRMAWSALEEAFLDECRDKRSATESEYLTLFAKLGELAPPQRVGDLTTARVKVFRQALEAEGLRPFTVRKHLSHLRAVANYAKKHDALPKLPVFSMPKIDSEDESRGRAITAAEFDLMLAAVPKAVIDPAEAKGMTGDAMESDPRTESWRHLLRGLWWSGMRIGEAMLLRWDEQPGGTWVELDGKASLLCFKGSAQKNGETQKIPLAPEAAAYLEPHEQDTGPVFAPRKIRGSGPMARDKRKWSRVVCKIGEAAGVVVNQTAGKHASAHDLRRSFGTRWAMRVPPAILGIMMRHKDPKTTARFYQDIDAQDAAAVAWNAVNGEVAV